MERELNDVTYRDKGGATVTIRWSVLRDVPEKELQRRRDEFNRLAQEMRIKYAVRSAEG